MHADKAGTQRFRIHLCELVDGQTRSTGCENGIRTDMVADAVDDALLGFKVLGNRFEDQVGLCHALRQIVEGNRNRGFPQ